jgi:glycosyltransferase involved in cell wall biosynthesis
VGKPDSGNPGSVPESQLKSWNDAGPVQWWGFRDDMAGVFGQCHIVCFPSMYGEGIPKVLIEAAASGKPIVATDIPGCREVVRNDNGILVAPGDQDALISALDKLIRDPVLRKTMGLRGREHFEVSFAMQGVIQATLRAYEEALAE